MSPKELWCESPHHAPPWQVDENVDESVLNGNDSEGAVSKVPPEARDGQVLGPRVIPGDPMNSW